MATTENNIELELAHLDAIIPHLDSAGHDFDYLRKLTSMGWLQASSIFETVIANMCNMDVTSTAGRDFSNGDDAKLSTVRTSSYGRAYSGPVHRVHTKTGDLIVQMYERIQKKMYYFYIPNHEFQHIPASSNIDIPFELDGTPRRVNRCFVNWWDYEVGGIEQLAAAILNKKIRKPQPTLSEIFFEA